MRDGRNYLPGPPARSAHGRRGARRHARRYARPAPLLLSAWMCAALCAACHRPYDVDPPEDPGPLPGLALLVFTKAAGYRHASLPAGEAALRALGRARNWSVVVTANGAAFEAAYLDRFDVVLWLNTTGDVLSPDQQAAFQAYIEAGGGFVGVHSAADTEHDWPWYGTLVGARQATHPFFPNVRNADVVIERTDHPATATLPARWNRADEWYTFTTNPRSLPERTVLASLDESSYRTGWWSMGDHPIAWHHPVGRGRAFYTGLGHTEQSYAEPFFLDHLAGAVEWAARP